ncbi:hypothetical protein JL720_13925 [Aureococcus anophagefferens]|nr:hypothetical protein JL720_13925 [Aureococcus anophagefferens]
MNNDGNRVAIVWLLCACAGSYTSQGPQDGIVQAVLDVIGETNQFFVEIGFNSDSFEGGAGSNTYALWRRGWRGLLFDSTFANSSINLHRAFVTPGTVAALLRRHGAPLEPDYVSVDIDSADVWVLRALLSTFRPRVVSVEYNSNFGDGERSSLAFPDAEWMPLGESAGAWRGSCFYGSSAAAVEAVARECGYVVAGVVGGRPRACARGALAVAADPAPRAHGAPRHVARDGARGRAALSTHVFARRLAVRRAAAAVALRRMAREPPPRCACFMKDLDCVEWTRNCSCFRDLADLPIPDCAPPVTGIDSPVSGADVQKNAIEVDITGERWNARVDLPVDYVQHRLDASSFLTHRERALRRDAWVEKPGGGARGHVAKKS